MLILLAGTSDMPVTACKADIGPTYGHIGPLKGQGRQRVDRDTFKCFLLVLFLAKI